MVYLISINYKWLLNIDQVFCDSYTCYQFSYSMHSLILVFDASSEMVSYISIKTYVMTAILP